MRADGIRGQGDGLAVDGRALEKLKRHRAAELLLEWSDRCMTHDRPEWALMIEATMSGLLEVTVKVCGSVKPVLGQDRLDITLKGGHRQVRDRCQRSQQAAILEDLDSRLAAGPASLPAFGLRLLPKQWGAARRLGPSSPNLLQPAGALIPERHSTYSLGVESPS